MVDPALVLADAERLDAALRPRQRRRPPGRPRPAGARGGGGRGQHRAPARPPGGRHPGAGAHPDGVPERPRAGVEERQPLALAALHRRRPLGVLLALDAEQHQPVEQPQRVGRVDGHAQLPRHGAGPAGGEAVLVHAVGAAAGAGHRRAAAEPAAVQPDAGDRRPAEPLGDAAASRQRVPLGAGLHQRLPGPHAPLAALRARPPDEPPVHALPVPPDVVRVGHRPGPRRGGPARAVPGARPRARRRLRPRLRPQPGGRALRHEHRLPRPRRRVGRLQRRGPVPERPRRDPRRLGPPDPPPRRGAGQRVQRPAPDAPVHAAGDGLTAGQHREAEVALVAAAPADQRVHQLPVARPAERGGARPGGGICRRLGVRAELAPDRAADVLAALPLLPLLGAARGGVRLVERLRPGPSRPARVHRRDRHRRHHRHLPGGVHDSHGRPRRAGLQPALRPHRRCAVAGLPAGALARDRHRPAHRQRRGLQHLLGPARRQPRRGRADAAVTLPRPLHRAEPAHRLGRHRRDRLPDPRGRRRPDPLGRAAVGPGRVDGVRLRRQLRGHRRAPRGALRRRRDAQRRRHHRVGIPLPDRLRRRLRGGARARLRRVRAERALPGPAAQLEHHVLGPGAAAAHPKDRQPGEPPARLLGDLADGLRDHLRPGRPPHPAPVGVGRRPLRGRGGPLGERVRRGDLGDRQRALPAARRHVLRLQAQHPGEPLHQPDVALHALDAVRLDLQAHLPGPPRGPVIRPDGASALRPPRRQ